MTKSKIIRPALLATLLAGCSSTGTEGYPSLAIRDVERVEGSFEPVSTQRLDVPAVEVDLTGGMEARLAALVGQASEAHGQFKAAQPEAERIVAAAGDAAIGSDSWAAAQVALADLDSARSIAAIALGDLDIIQGAAEVQAEDTSAIDAAREQVVTLISEEDAVLVRLRARIR
ncbi:MAG: hypothetical protein R3E14_01970 [Erythrobacter sp.]